jgi:drug/metabolite transporter (DMT)-like permease
MQQLLPTLLLLFIAAVWGWSFTLVKEATSHYGVVPFLVIRFVIGSAAIGLVAARRLTRRSLLTGGLIGVALAMGYLTQTWGLRTTTATNSGLITGLFVVFAPLINRLLFGVRTRPALWAAIAASVAGMALLTGAGPSRPTIGDALTLACAASYGLQIALLDRYAKGHDPAAMAFAQLTSAALCFLVISPLSEPFSWPTPEVWTALIITGILCTAVGFYIQAYAQQRLPAVRAAFLINLEPVFAALAGYYLAGDRLRPLQWAGAVLMVAAMLAGELLPAMASRRRRPPSHPSPLPQTSDVLESSQV